MGSNSQRTIEESVGETTAERSSAINANPKQNGWLAERGASADQGTRTAYTPVKPGGRHPLFAQAKQTFHHLGRPLSRPGRLTINSVEVARLQTSQTALSALFSLALSLAIEVSFPLANLPGRKPAG